MDKEYPKVGIGVMIKNDKNEILLGLRQGSHGSGEWAFPGGHLEFGEIIFQTAKREVKEETGLEVDEFELISVSDEMRYIETDNKHYLNNQYYMILVPLQIHQAILSIFHLFPDCLKHRHYHPALTYSSQFHRI